MLDNRVLPRDGIMPQFLYMWVPRYNIILTAVLEEVLLTERELHNMTDHYAMAVKKHSGETVGHLPRKISRMYNNKAET